MSGQSSGPGSVRRYHRIVKDTIKTIQPSVFKEQLTDTSDIVGKAKLAPKSKKDMEQSFYDNLDNYFAHSGRKVVGRPLQKIVERQIDTLRKEFKTRVAQQEKEEKKIRTEPLTDDLRTENTKGLPSLMESTVPAMTHVFPKRSPSDIRRSYAKKKKPNGPQKPAQPQFLVVGNTLTPIPPDLPGLIQLVSSDSGPISATVPVSSKRRSAYSTRSKAKTPSKPGYITADSQGSGRRPQSPLKHYVITGDQVPMEITLAHVPQYTTEVSVDHAGVVTTTEAHPQDINSLVLSELIESTDGTQVDGKIEINSTNQVILCDSFEAMNQVIVMGQNGERYRLLALNDGQLSLVSESTVQ